jgi:hypothetical protein
MLAAFEPRHNLRAVRKVLRIVRGSPSATPTPIVLKYSDIGLLYLLNQKQAQLHEALQAFTNPQLAELPALLTLADFMKIVVGGLIIEAERVDAAVIAVQKEMARVGSELRHCDVELQHQRLRLGTHVEQAIAQHYRGRLSVPQRFMRPRIDVLGDTENRQLGELPTAIVSLRAQLGHLRRHFEALKVMQRLIHGGGLRMPEAEAAAVVAELDISSTFRKAAHRVRDHTYDLAGKDDLDAVNSMHAFIDMLCTGFAAAVDDILHLENEMVKHVAEGQASALINQLTATDARNKVLSAEALFFNEGTAAVAASTATTSLMGTDAAPRLLAPPRITAPRVAPEAQPKTSLDDFLSQYCA